MHSAILRQICLFIRLSVTFRYCMETNAHIAKLFPQSVRGMILVFRALCVTKFQGKLLDQAR